MLTILTYLPPFKNMIKKQEWDQQAQNELRSHPFKPNCLYGDITSFLLPGLANELQHMKDTGTIDRLKEHVISGKALKASLKAHCVIQGKQCQLEAGSSMHVAGTPCTADSSMGLQEGKQSLPFCYFLTWVALRCVMNEPVIIQECVDAFDRTNFTELLGQYDWSFVVLSPKQFAWPISRNRQWAVSLVMTKNN